jgi:hypothetical protein
MRYVSEHRADDEVLGAWYDFRDTIYPHMIVRDDVQDIEQVVSEVATLCESGLHPCVIVDYLQLAAAGDKDEYQLVTNASHVLQKMAKKLNIPVLLVSSLRNLNKAERDDEPQLSQFRGSGHVGYDAGAAIVLRKSGGPVSHRGIGIRQGDGSLVWKWDCGIESREDGEGNEKKGEASDAFKRAGFRWGIGRELYTSPFVWIGADKAEIKVSQHNGKTTYKCFDKFSVERIAYNEETGRIIGLAIRNESKKCRAFVWQA